VAAQRSGRPVRSSGRLQKIQDPSSRPQTFSIGAIDIGQPGRRMPLEAKGTLLEGAGAPGAGSGGGLLAVPDVVPGVVTTLFQRLSVADLFASATTTSNTVRYVIEGTATSGAADVAEGRTKPESTLGLSAVDEPVKKISTSIVTSDELLEDGAATSQFVGGRLSLFVKIEEERQLLRGAGGNELTGIVGRSGVNTWARGTVDSNAVALFKAANGLRGSSFLEPDAIIMNPTNWQTARLGTDTARPVNAQR
jgi:HK97 family phage major capsid protein